MTAPTISASAIESFDPALGGCARKWAFSRLDNVPKPQTPGAALGSRCHELWESYLWDGVPFDLSTVEGRICQATQHQLPKPGTCMAVEEPFRFGWEGVTWAGKKDVEYWDEATNLYVVLDHKTTSDFRYAKSERASLLGHPQAPLYALEMLTRGTDARVGLAWNYVKHGVTFDKDAPPGPYGYAIKRAGRPVALEPPVRLVVERAEAEDALGKFVPTAKRMLQVIASPPTPGEDGSIARQLEPNPDACEAFGGCPYRAQCGLTPQEIASRLVRSFPEENGEQKNMGSALRDRIAAIKAGNGGPVMSSAIGVQQAIEAERAAKAQAAVVATAQEFVGNAGTVKAEPASLLPKAQVYGPVNPPEGATAHEHLRGTNLIPVETKTREDLEKVYPPEPAPLPPAEAPTRPDTPQAKPRRGRPPGSKNKVKGELPPAETQTICPSDGPVPPLAATHEVLTYDPADTIPAPSAELLSDDVLEEVSRRVGRRLARAFLEALGDEAKEDKVLA